MKKWLLTLAVVGAMTIAMTGAALAHFQMVYTPDSALKKGAVLDFKVVFTHPFEAGHTMEMGVPEQFFVVHKKKKKDLLKSLKPITWTSLTNSGKAFEFSDKLRGMGDWVYCLTPSPYYEKSEDVYIQQITKTVVNVNGAATNWDEEIGLDAEIVPLDKPYGLWTGCVFRGIVKSAGRPVPYAEVEVELMNHEPLMKENRFAKKAKVENGPNDAFVTMTIKANANGEFAFAIPKAGWWGFCALGVGPKKEFKGKELSQDAVIWVQAFDMK